MKHTIAQMLEENLVAPELLDVFLPGDCFITTEAQAATFPKDRADVSGVIIAIPTGRDYELQVVRACKVVVRKDAQGNTTDQQFWSHRVRSQIKALGGLPTFIVTTGPSTNRGTANGILGSLQDMGMPEYSQAAAYITDEKLRTAYPGYILYPSSYELALTKKPKRGANDE